MTATQIMFKTVLAIILSGLVGMERQNKNRPAGFKTHILVCLGAMTIMILSKMLFMEYYADYGISLDPTRMSAQVISGIGFLGAGTIIHYGSVVKGLTTAASLWVVAAIGTAVGGGFYLLAIIVTLFIWVTLSAFNFISKKFEHKGHVLELRIECYNKPKAIGIMNIVFAKNNLKILSMDISTQDKEIIDSKGEELIFVRVILQIAPETEVYTIIQELEKINGVLRVERL